MAHRGASAQRAEHTLAAYLLALRQGADGLECDIRLTRDGHLVCVHDRRVDRTSSGRGVVSTLTLEQLAAFDYGSWHGERARAAGMAMAEPGDGPVAADAERGLLTLETLLGLVVDAGRPITLFVETKHPVRYGGRVEARLVEVLARYGLAHPRHKEESRVVMMSFSGHAVRRMRAHAPTLPTVLLFGRIPAARRDGSLPPWADFTGPGVHLLRQDPDYVARSAARGNHTYCWTVDEPADVQLCQDLGVRYLATNLPDNTRRLLQPAGGALPR
ncbi:glycerophosphodiester phosphodiesterase family protein [Goodfellowiella coeruleoviolacea]|uniref:glycerophosphodiester phosphodiesterase family protein n=1 Tax=Goodfellowiella coeruleoviolacea TaxID=334858 RepID=UPI0020A40A32|nr:glycerophosphodiester phosphodiesterase family protein [Goodfellowiella coeruleoviolacea]